MQGNQIRDTAGRVMLLWAAGCLLVVVFAWRVHLGRSQFDWAEYPTALGDPDCYSDSAMLGENDFFSPNLKFQGREKGLYRRMHAPKARNDEEMIKIARESTGRFFVYAEARAAQDNGGASSGRFYLKAGENAFLEFGERKYYPEYKEPTAGAPSPMPGDTQ